MSENSLSRLGCILLVEDNKLTNIYNQKILEKLDVTDTIEVALNGKEAIQYLKESNGSTEGMQSENPMPDLIFLDINMPVMDGWEFLAEYEKLDPVKKRNIIIVMLTTSPDPNDENQGRKVPEVADFVKKPLTKDKISNIIGENFPPSRS